MSAVKTQLATTPNILTEAHDKIYGDRQEAYGDPEVNLSNIAEQWSLYLQQRYGDVPLSEVQLSAEDVCWMMIDVKKCRQMVSPKRDNLIDVAGYAATIERIEESELRAVDEHATQHLGKEALL